MKGQALMGHKILQELYSLDPPGHIWLELQETANVFHEVTNECQAAHICRIFLILAWHPLVCYDDSEDVDESTKFVEGANIDPKPMPLEQDHDLTAEPERRHRTRGGMHPVMGSVVVDFFATFNRIQNRASQAVSNQTDESELNK